METSILTSTKKLLGIGPDDETFDLDVITHINSAFSTLHQVGIGPVEGFGIEDDNAEWGDFIDMSDIPAYNSVKTYVGLKVRMLFDPPTTAYLLTAYKEQIQELEWRLNVVSESSFVAPVFVIDGGDPEE